MSPRRFSNLLVGGGLLLSLLALGWSAIRLGPVEGACVITVGIALFLVAAGVAIKERWAGAFIDDRNRISLSRCQLVAWLLLIVPVLLAGLFFNIRTLPAAAPAPADERAGGAPVVRGAEALDVRIPGNVLALLGISVASMAASPLVRSMKRSNPQDPAAARETIERLNERAGVLAPRMARGSEIVNVSGRDAAWSDIVLGEETGNGSHLDLGKLQNLYITVAVLFAYGTQLYGTLSNLPILARFDGLPELGDGLVYLVGLSHAGYLSYKAVPHSSPPAAADARPTPASLRRAEGAIEHPGTEPAP